MPRNSLHPVRPSRGNSQVKEANEKIYVSFQDTGHGISKENLPKIFDLLFTTSYSDARGTIKGTGLGLSICQRIIEAHQGSIEVESKPQKGVTFTIRLPTLSP